MKASSSLVMIKGIFLKKEIVRVGSRIGATSRMERFVIIVNGIQPLTIITKFSILDVTAVLDPPLILICCCKVTMKNVVENIDTLFLFHFSKPIEMDKRP